MPELSYITVRKLQSFKDKFKEEIAATTIEESGYDLISRLGMPSNVGGELLEDGMTNDEEYSLTADHDGWIVVKGTASSQYASIRLQCLPIENKQYAFNIGDDISFSLPIKRGGTCIVEFHNMDISKCSMKFFYTMGAIKKLQLET